MGVKKNIILENVLVENYAADGKCLARVDGKVIFVERVVPGDVVDLRLIKNKKDWAEGFPVAFRAYSKDRVTPVCKHFGVCGGCQWQMLPYEMQLEFKQQQVWDNLQRIGKITPAQMLPMMGAASTFYYRNKIEYTFATEEYTALPPAKNVEQTEASEAAPNKGFAGFHARGHWSKIVDIETCHLQAEPSNAIRTAIKNFAIENNLSFYNLRSHQGFLRAMQVRLCNSGEWMANIMFGNDDMKNITAAMEFLLHKFPDITSLLYTINTKQNDSLYNLKPVAFFGNGYVMEEMEDFRFKIGPKSFFQTNTSQGIQLYRVAREFAELSGHQTVYDLYCGTGSIGIFCSKNAGKIIGVELVEEAINDANENAAKNGLRNAEFFAGDVIDICTDDFFAQHGRPDVIITDPPRAGMHQKLIEKINEIAAPVVVYVSCNPATQARDLALLDEKYMVTKAQPVDMFPHTLHIENVVQLKLR